MSQTKPHPWRHPPPKPVPWRVYLACLPRGESQNPRESHAKLRRQGQAPRSGGRAGWCAVWYNLRMGWWIPAKFGTEMANAILFISYLDKICLTLTGSLWRALACLYSEVRLYKGARTASPPQSAASHSTGNISVGVKKVGHSNTRGTVSSFVPFPPKYCCTIVYIFNISNAD